MGDGLDVSDVTVAPMPLAFNSTKYPGLCKPSDVATLAAFKNLQSQMNRLAQAKALPKIAVDGDIGPGTVSLASKLGLIGAGATCSAIAVAATFFALQAKNAADKLGAPTTVSGPAPAHPPTLVNAAGAEFAAPAPSIGEGVMGFFTNLSTFEEVAAVGILGGIGYFVLAKKRKRGKSRSRRY